MKTRKTLPVAGVTLALLATVGAHAKEGYDAPHDWPSPMAKHHVGTAVFDRLEYVFPDKEDEALVWDFEAWYGGDISRFYLKSEGENVQGDGAGAEFEALDLRYSHLIADFWELQGGIGYQGNVGTNDHPERFYGVIGLQGTAPYRIETSLDLNVSEDGDAWVQVEAEHDVRLTQRWYLQPRAELVAAGSAVEEFHMGSGVNTLNAGLRLRYEITRKLAPYVGAYWEKSYGETADMARAHGEPTEDTGLVAGVRLLF
ncbi:copper resistance protein B [Billgrantia antri]|uniref:Copper resistance protein B n=1 Tax=Billgrantia antri TaxID=2846777 RepID=A0ABS6ZQW8_9GAMM|nr:copper resistance protein B [Halomonas antri]MBW6392463.1 copper resistance protein B [Halomonas antri]